MVCRTRHRAIGHHAVFPAHADRRAFRRAGASRYRRVVIPTACHRPTAGCQGRRPTACRHRAWVPTACVRGLTDPHRRRPPTASCPRSQAARRNRCDHRAGDHAHQDYLRPHDHAKGDHHTDDHRRAVAIRLHAPAGLKVRRSSGLSRPRSPRCGSHRPTACFPDSRPRQTAPDRAAADRASHRSTRCGAGLIPLDCAPHCDRRLGHSSHRAG